MGEGWRGGHRYIRDRVTGNIHKYDKRKGMIETAKRPTKTTKWWYYHSQWQVGNILSSVSSWGEESYKPS